MDRGTKIYSIILGVFCLGLAFIFLYETPKVKILNHKLNSVSEIQQFPFKFKVLRINDRVATINSPISIELPCGEVIGIIFPAIKGRSLLSQEYQDAQKLLARIQMQIGDIIKSDPDIDKIVWELDKSWLIQNGVTFNNL